MSPAPRHVHAVRRLARPLAEVVAHLRSEADSLALTATSAAVAAAEDAEHLAELAAPRIKTRVHDDDLAIVSVGWNDESSAWPPAGRFPFATFPTSRWWHREEERTGWPSLVLNWLCPRRRAERG